MPGKPSPYFALLDPRVTAWIRTLGERERPDAVWFHDDVPRAAREWAGRARAFLYVHFPLAARSASVAPPLRRTRGRSEAAQEALLRRLRSRLVVDRPQDLCESIQTNSRVTQRACGTVWGSKPTIWPTYVSPPVAGASGSAPSAVSLAAFHQGKGLEMLLRAFARTTVPEARITLLGHLRDPTHLGRLRRLASAGAGARRVRFVPDASREQVLDAWRDARLVVSSTEFEPFGLSLVEGMSYGIPAIARSSAWSGAWTDVLEEGRFGDGFGSLEELTGCLDRLLGQSSAAGRDAARARSAAFSEPRFVEGLRKVFGG
jgi:glycosyltransferase involved in cell wall biosynthesis